MRAALTGLVIAATVAIEIPVHAQTALIELPAGRLSEQVIRLASDKRLSVAITDQELSSRRVPALRGRMTPEMALRAIARNAGARIEKIDSRSFRLVADARRRAVPPVQEKHKPRVTPPPPDNTSSSDIIVTASKRDVSRDRFAGQVMRVAGTVLEQGGSGGTDRLIARTANIASTYLGAGRNKIFIRGIADSSFTGPTQATVGQYLGDIRLNYNAPDPDLRLADLAAVEVLEGPQGTLYGAGSLGGLVRLVPNPVNLSVAEGSAAVGASITAHGQPGVDTQGVINLPVLRDRLGIRIVAGAEKQGGYIDKPLLGRKDVNTTRIEGGRATVHLKIDDKWSAELIGIGQRIVGDDSQYADRDGPPLTRVASVAEGFRAKFQQGQIVVAGRIGDVRVRSSSALTYHDLLENYDATPQGGVPTVFDQRSRTRMRANETRVWRSQPDGTGWLAGLSLTENKTTITRGLRRLDDIGPPDFVIPMLGVQNDVREATAYGEASVRLLPHVLVNGGLRITHVDVGGGYSEGSIQSFPQGGAMRLPTSGELIALPAVSAVFELTPRSSMFARYQQGYRPGGIVVRSGTSQRFRSDHVSTFELGYRTGRPNTDAFDLSLTVAHTNWTDIQADYLDEFGFPSTANIGDGRVWTFEANGGLNVARGLRLEAAVTLNASVVGDREQLTSVPDQGGMAITDPSVAARLRQIPNIAGMTGRVGATFRRPIGGDAVFAFDAWTRYIGSSRLGAGPALGQRQGDLLDSSANLRVGNAEIGLSLNIANVFNVIGNRFALGTPFMTGREQITPLRPRSVRLGFDASF